MFGIFEYVIDWLCHDKPLWVWLVWLIVPLVLVGVLPGFLVS
jgi:hypothetical protein